MNSNISISDTINEIFSGNAFPYVHPSAFYAIENRSHLLTSWIPGIDAFDYSANSAWFGKCARWDVGDYPLKPTNGPKIPNGCIALGGRVGYSVKMVSEGYLKNPSLPLGGNGASAGPILNPPPW